MSLKFHLGLVCLWLLTMSWLAFPISVAVGTDPWLEWASIAWRYYQPGKGVNPTTGLHYGTLDWHYITDWDTGNYLIAILDARALNLIQDTGEWGTDYRLDKVLHYLETRKLRPSDGLPYAAYNSENGQPGTELSRQVTDVVDAGRLLVALYIVKTRRPDLAGRVSGILDRCALNCTPPQTPTSLRSVYNTAFIQGQTHSGVYEYYATLGFNQFGFDVSSSLTSWNKLENGPQVNVYGQLLPRADVTTEPFLNGILEIPNLIDDGFKTYAYRVLEAQEGRWQATGYLTAWSEGAIDVTPYYQYEWIVHTLGEQSPKVWKIVGPSQSDIDSGKTPIVYTKVAFAFHALYSTAYTRALITKLLAVTQTEYGFREGIRENTGEVIGTPTWPIQDKTNSFIIAAARYASITVPEFHYPQALILITFLVVAILVHRTSTVVKLARSRSLPEKKGPRRSLLSVSGPSGLPPTSATKTSPSSSHRSFYFDS